MKSSKYIVLRRTSSVGRRYRFRKQYQMRQRIMNATVLIIALLAILLAISIPSVASHGEEPVRASCEAVQSVEIEQEPVPEPEPMTVTELIEFYADKNGVDYNLAYWVAFCESELKNVPNHEGSTYGQGIYQFVQTTWDARCEGDVWDIEANIDCGTKLLGLGELSHWQPYSGHCWLPKL